MLPGMRPGAKMSIASGCKFSVGVSVYFLSLSDKTKVMGTVVALSEARKHYKYTDEILKEYQSSRIVFCKWHKDASYGWTYEDDLFEYVHEEETGNKFPAGTRVYYISSVDSTKSYGIVVSKETARREQPEFYAAVMNRFSEFPKEIPVFARFDDYRRIGWMPEDSMFTDKPLTAGATMKDFNIDTFNKVLQDSKNICSGARADIDRAVRAGKGEAEPVKLKVGQVWQKRGVIPQIVVEDACGSRKYRVMYFGNDCCWLDTNLTTNEKIEEHFAKGWECAGMIHDLLKNQTPMKDQHFKVGKFA
jgi:hypothetical protein